MADGSVDIDLYADDLESDFNQDGLEAEGVDLYDDVITAPSLKCEEGLSSPRLPTSDLTRHGNIVGSAGNSNLKNNLTLHANKKWQIYVGNLTWWTTDQDVIDALGNIGVADATEVKFYENRANGQSKGFCVVTLGSETSVKYALERLTKKELHGQLPVVTHASKQALSQFEAQSKTRPSPQTSNHQGSSSGLSPRQLPPGSSRLSGGLGGLGRELKTRNASSGSSSSVQKILGSSVQAGMSQGIHPYGLSHSIMSTQGALSVLESGHRPSHIMNMSGQMSPRNMPDTRGPPPRPDWSHLPGPSCPPPLTSIHPLGPPPRVPPPAAMPPHLSCPPPQSIPAPHVNPAFLPPQSHPPPLIPPPGYGAPPPIQPLFGHDRREIPSLLSELEFEECMNRNRTVSSSAIARAVSDAAAGDFASAIETLVTAISLIKQSKVASDERCIILISSLQDTLHGIEAKSYSNARRDHDRSHSRDRHTKRKKEKSRQDRDRSHEKQYREYRNRRDSSSSSDRNKDRESNRSREYKEYRDYRDCDVQDRSHDQSERRSYERYHGRDHERNDKDRNEETTRNPRHMK